VVLHVHRCSCRDSGRHIIDIFRVEDGKVVEHWDVIQNIPSSYSPLSTTRLF